MQSEDWVIVLLFILLLRCVYAISTHLFQEKKLSVIVYRPGPRTVKTVALAFILFILVFAIYAIINH